MTIAFNCESCGAGLKVKVGAAGHTVLCPKCGKKIRVPKEDGSMPEERRRRGERKTKFGSRAGDTAVETDARQSSPPMGRPGPAAEKPAGVQAEKAVEPPPPTAPKVDVPMPVDSPRPEPVKREAPTATKPSDDAASKPDARDAEIRRLRERVENVESDLKSARNSLEEEKTARRSFEADQPDRSEIEKTVAAKYDAQVEAAKKTISDLEAKVSAEYRKRIELESRVTDGREAAAVQAGSDVPEPRTDQTRDVIDADALISDITTSSFGRHLRTALVIHVVLILATSVFVIYRMFTKADETAAPAEAAVSAAQENVSDVEPEVDASMPETEVEPVPEAASREEPPPAERTELERSLETLPNPAELPTDTAVSLEEDL